MLAKQFGANRVNLGGQSTLYDTTGKYCSIEMVTLFSTINNTNDAGV